MSSKWGSGNPAESLPSGYYSAAFDDHRYLKWSPDASDVSHAGYLKVSCGDDRTASGEDPTVVGEFSLSVPDDVQWSDDWKPSDANVAFYKQWFEAQVMAYEKGAGWAFWTWKAELGDWRWSYRGTWFPIPGLWNIILRPESSSC
jgi:hypothetical protein